MEGKEEATFLLTSAILRVSPTSSSSSSSSESSPTSSASSTASSSSSSGMSLRRRRQKNRITNGCSGEVLMRRHSRPTLQAMSLPLKRWLRRHRALPYPSLNDKRTLAAIANMTVTQVSNWFANARRRLKRTVHGASISWATRIQVYDSFVVGKQEPLNVIGSPSTSPSTSSSEDECCTDVDDDDTVTLKSEIGDDERLFNRQPQQQQQQQQQRQQQHHQHQQQQQQQQQHHQYQQQQQQQRQQQQQQQQQHAAGEGVWRGVNGITWAEALGRTGEEGPGYREYSDTFVKGDKSIVGYSNTLKTEEKFTKYSDTPATGHTNAGFLNTLETSSFSGQFASTLYHPGHGPSSGQDSFENHRSVKLYSRIMPPVSLINWTLTPGGSLRPPVGQPAGQPVRQPVGQRAAQPVGQLDMQLVEHPFEEPTGQSVELPVGQPVGQLAGHPAWQPENDPMGQTVATLPFGRMRERQPFENDLRTHAGHMIGNGINWTTSADTSTKSFEEGTKLMAQPLLNDDENTNWMPGKFSVVNERSRKHSFGNTDAVCGAFGATSSVSPELLDGTFSRFSQRMDNELRKSSNFSSFGAVPSGCRRMRSDIDKLDDPSKAEKMDLASFTEEMDWKEMSAVLALTAMAARTKLRLGI